MYVLVYHLQFQILPINLVLSMHLRVHLDVNIERHGIELGSIPNRSSIGNEQNTNAIVWMQVKLCPPPCYLSHPLLAHHVKLITSTPAKSLGGARATHSTPVKGAVCSTPSTAGDRPAPGGMPVEGWGVADSTPSEGRWWGVAGSS